MDPEYEAIVLFISTTNGVSSDWYRPAHTAEYKSHSLHYTIYSLPFILGNWSLRYESFGVYASKHATLRVYMGEWAISTRNKIQLARYQLARENEPLVVMCLVNHKVPPQNALGAF
eukprot:COSAG01_NODE_1734_length_9366_cov_4.124636_7_plen_116_part_00